MFEQPIDSFRLRVEDEYTFTGKSSTVYVDEDLSPECKRFLKLAKGRKGLGGEEPSSKRQSKEKIGEVPISWVMFIALLLLDGS